MIFVNDERYFLFIKAAKKIHNDTNNANSEAFDYPKEPSFVFLIETLIPKRSINTRNSMSYLSLKTWRKPIQPYQIQALRALKENLPPEVAPFIAREILREVETLFGLSAFRAVVPMPCGHARATPCLSLEIARAIEAQSGVQIIRALSTKSRKGSSHPKENLRRPPLVLRQQVSDAVLLVDDVATSGSHMKEAIGLLKPGAGSVLAVAWISA